MVGLLYRLRKDLKQASQELAVAIRRGRLHPECAKSQNLAPLTSAPFWSSPTPPAASRRGDHRDAQQKAQLPALPFASMASPAPRPSLDRVLERRRAVALARHYREAE
jgi:hypothetical protein